MSNALNIYITYDNLNSFFKKYFGHASHYFIVTQTNNEFFGEKSLSLFTEPHQFVSPH